MASFEALAALSAAEVASSARLDRSHSFSTLATAIEQSSNSIPPEQQARRARGCFVGQWGAPAEPQRKGRRQLPCSPPHPPAALCGEAKISF
eukprot:scaffold135708_cov33-Tisochrysis_lutea.AAC.4